MTRLIDADELKDWSEIVPLTGDGGIDINDFDEKLKSMPTVDAVPVVHGRWIDEGQYADYYQHHAWQCSECGEHVIEIDTPWYKYCPYCGARMDEE